MKALKVLLSIFLFSCLYFSAPEASAQCAMCTLNAENSVKNGNTEGNSLNDGILYLLAAPYIAMAGVGLIWYKKYRRKNVAIHMKDEKIHLN